MKKFIVLLTLIFCLTGSMVSYAGTWIPDSQGWKFRDDDGTMLKDTFIREQDGGRIYYLDSNGYRCTGIATIEGKEFCFSADGVLQTNGKTSDGRLVEATGQVIDDVNDGYTFMIQTMSEKKVGNSRYITIVIRNECDKSFILRPTSTYIRDGQEKTLYLLDVENREFCDEKTIQPNETFGFSFLDTDYSEFYVDEKSRLEIYCTFENEDISLGMSIGEGKRGHLTPEYIHNSSKQE